MHSQTRQLINAYFTQVAKANGVASVAEKFAATPAVEQQLEKEIQESDDFLGMVGFYGVDNQSGQKIGLLSNSSIAARTNTSGEGERVPTNPTDSGARGYKCEQTNYDTALRYDLLDAWRHRPEFQTIIREIIIRQQALDRITIGWNGESVAADTDRNANPLLQDVNIGWLKKLEIEASTRFMTEGSTANQVRVGSGAGADYANLDELIHDVRGNLLGTWHKRDNRFKVITASDVSDEKFLPMVAAHANTPTEANAMDAILAARRLGGLGVVEPPNFPERTLMVTLLGANNMGSNLSIYTQNGSRRRNIVDNPKKDQIEDFQSVNEAYVIEDLTGCAAVKNIKFWDGSAWV